MRKTLIALTWIVLVAFAVLPRSATVLRSADSPPTQTARPTAAPRQGDLSSLESLAPLKEAFQRDRGRVRLVALVPQPDRCVAGGSPAS
jgi:hypothetical protein